MSNIFRYIKNIVLVVIVFTFSFSSITKNVFAEQVVTAYEYTKVTGVAGGYISPVTSAIDSDNNVYVAGYFSGTSMDFDPSGSVDAHTSNGIFDIYLTKINADGSYGYTKTMGDDGYESANSIAFDSSNNVYVAGYFGSASMDFDPTVGVDTHTSNGDTDIFFTKINADGSYGYTKTAGGGAGDVISAIGIDSADNIYLGGYFFDVSVDFDSSGGIDTHTNNGSSDMFLTKINADGSYGYTKTVGGGGGEFIYSIKLDSADNIYLGGHFSTGSMDFDSSGGIDTHTNNGDTDIFFTKINADGSYGYTKTIGGGGGDVVNSVGVDTYDNVYIAGNFSGASVDFDPFVAVDAHTSNGGTDIFFTKINADGSYGYTKTAGGSAGDVIKSIEVDSDNNVYIAGYFSSNTIDLDPTPGVDTYTNGNNDGSYDIFFTKINADASYGYTKAVAGDGYDAANSIVVDSNNNVYLVGDFGSASMDFDPTVGVDTHTLAGSSDAFLSKFSQVTTYSLTYTAGANGTLTGTASQTIDEGEDGTAVTAVPNAGYRFLDWSDASTANPRTDTNITADLSITANFEIIPASNSSGSRRSLRPRTTAPNNPTINTNNSNPNPTQNSNISNTIQKYIFTKTLRNSSTGEDVKELQKYLNAHGFPVSLSGPGSLGNETNYFGPKTKSALMLFQKSKGLVPDGIMGPITRGVLNAE
ncbi:MAG: peptidoglycan-binding protein [Candidatus Pacebacteria bacterium]|nr:peptidoglycan-binding protein [Candidatus Paceibacterota bacterium]